MRTQTYAMLFGGEPSCNFEVVGNTAVPTCRVPTPNRNSNLNHDRNRRERVGSFSFKKRHLRFDNTQYIYVHSDHTYVLYRSKTTHYVVVFARKMFSFREISIKLVPSLVGQCSNVFTNSILNNFNR